MSMTHIYIALLYRKNEGIPESGHKCISKKSALLSVWPDWAIYWTLDNFLKPLATINLRPNHPTFLGNFCKGVKIYHFISEIIFGQLLWTLCDFFWSHWLQRQTQMMLMSLEISRKRIRDKPFLPFFRNVLAKDVVTGVIGIVVVIVFHRQTSQLLHDRLLQLGRHLSGFGNRLKVNLH